MVNRARGKAIERLHDIRSGVRLEPLLTLAPKRLGHSRPLRRRPLGQAGSLSPRQNLFCCCHMKAIAISVARVKRS